MPYHKFRPLKQWGRYNTRLFRQLYREKLKEEGPPLVIPAWMKEANVSLEDPNDKSFGVRHTQSAPVESSVATNGANLGRLFNGCEPFAEGVNQALVLMKAVRRDGLPAVNQKTTVNTQHLDERIQKLILLSQQWDSTLERLPPRINPIEPFWKFDPYYGIPLERKNQNLIDSLVRLSLSANPRKQSDRLTYRGGKIHSNVVRETDRVRFVTSPHLSLLRFGQSAPLVQENDVVETANEPLADIFPLSWSVDLVKDKEFSDQTEYPGFASRQNPTIHTVFLSRGIDYKYPWTPAQNTADLLLNTFNAAVAVAKFKNPNVKELAHPAVVNGVQVCGHQVNFVSLQLNTLNLVDDSGVKNIAYIDAENELFKPTKHWENMAAVEDYNPTVFHKLCALLWH